MRSNPNACSLLSEVRKVKQGACASVFVVSRLDTNLCRVCVCVESLDDKIQWNVVQSCSHLHVLVVELSHASV